MPEEGREGLTQKSHANGPLRKDENKRAGKRSLKKMVLREGERFY